MAIRINFFAVATLISVAITSGCTVLSNKEPFQIYEPRSECVSCKTQDKWGFEKKLIFRNNKVAYFASYQPKSNRSTQLEHVGLCYGTALDTIKSGATHFRILSKEKWGNWYSKPTPATISRPDLLGTMTIQEAGYVRANRDQDGMWWTNHYYEKGSPKCENELCSKSHEFDLRDCPYEGEELRKNVEDKKSSLACVMKHNPALLLHQAYSSEAGCGSATNPSDPAEIRTFMSKRLELDYWVPAKDIIKKFETLFSPTGERID